MNFSIEIQWEDDPNHTTIIQQKVSNYYPKTKRGMYSQMEKVTDLMCRKLKATSYRKMIISPIYS